MTKTKGPKRQAVIYVRISKDRTGEGLGVERQTADCRALCERNGWEVVEVCTDNDVSANTSRKRPGYERALALVKAGQADAWVSWAYDRVMRRLSDLDPFLDAMKNAQATAHFVQAGGIDLSTDMGQAIAGMAVVMAKLETGQKSTRQKAAYRQRAQQGKRHNGGPRAFGWNEDRTTVHPVEGPAIAQAVRDVANGRTLASVIREWDANPALVPSRQGRWTYSSVRHTLTRPSNAGIVTYKGTVLRDVDADWEPIVTVPEHEAVCAVVSTPERRTSTGYNLIHVLSGLAKCGVCGESLIVGAVTIRGAHRRIFRCKAGAQHVHRSYDPASEAVEQAVVMRLSQPDVADLFRAPTKKETQSVYQRIDRLRSRIEQAERDYEDGNLTGQQLRTVTENLTARIREEQATVTTQTVTAVPERVRKVKPETVREVWESLAPAEKRNVIGVLLTCTIYPTTDAEHGALPYGWLIEWK